MDGALKQLGKYQLVDVVGTGAMGVVHRAFDPVLNRTIAIKVMSVVIASDTQLRERFLREARTAGSLQHPNVITIYDFGEVNDHLYIAMEYVEGYDLAETISKRVPLAIEAKLDILIDALNGLSYAHSHGVVHRDIKPANIRVTLEGRAKLMDFGIAHMQKSDLTRSGELIGTPQYMAPEQVKGEPVSAATDIFSMACVAYEFFAYARPFDGETLHAVLFEIVSGDPEPLSTKLPSLPPALSAIVAKGMSKDPKARYESAAAMAKAFLLVRQSLTLSQDPGSLVSRSSMVTTEIPRTVASRPRKGLTRGVKLAIGGVAAAALVVVGVLSLSSGGPSDATPITATPTAEAPTAERRTAEPPTDPTLPTVVATPVPVAPAAAPPAATREASGAVTSVRASAILARGRAVEAGAVAGDLASGDNELQAADAAVARGREGDAFPRLAIAIQLWATAEQQARDRATTAAKSLAEATVTPLSVTVPRPEPSPPAPATAASGAVSEEAARATIARVIGEYEVAIESGDLGRIRQAYPGLTASQQANWEGFFRSARNFRATLTASPYAINAGAATIALDAIYEYDNRSTGRAERHALKLTATLSAGEGGAWRLGAIR